MHQTIAIIFVLVGWVVIVAIFAACVAGTVKAYRAGNFWQMVVCAVAAIVAAIPIVGVGF